MNQCKISPLALGLSFGVLSGVAVVIAALLTLFLNDKPVVLTLSSTTAQYELSVLLSFFAGLVTFVHGLIVGALIGGLYNCFLGCCAASCEPKAKPKKSKKE